MIEKVSFTARAIRVAGPIIMAFPILGGCSASTDPSKSADGGGHQDVSLLLPSPDAGPADGGIRDAASCFADGDRSNKCYTCLDKYCCAPQAVATASDAGKNWNDCQKLCPAGDYQCRYQCDMSNSAGFVAEEPYVACAELACLDECTEGESDASLSCAACQLANCRAESNACAENLDCSLLIACGSVCDVGDTTCQENCASSVTPQGRNLLQASLTCSLAACTAACDTTTSCGLAVGTASCAACQQVNCCGQAAACAADPVCAAIATCSAQCTSAACLSDCQAGIDGGPSSATWHALFTCEGNAGCKECF